MTEPALTVDLYWSFRSPYSYLATPRLCALEAETDVRFNVRPVLPLALRQRNYFKDANPLWLPYLLTDVAREAERLGLPIRAPNPDPIVMNMETGEVADAQPYIHRLTRLGVLAAETGDGLSFLKDVSALIWSGRVESWNEGPHLAEAAAHAGFDLDALDRRAEKDPERLDRVIAENGEAQRAAGHWGVPLMVFNGEPFFGQDRIDSLIWRLERHGITRSR